MKSRPRSIRTFRPQNRRIHAIKPQEIMVKICQCFEGSNKVVHFSGKVLDLDSPQAQSRPRQQARQRRNCRTTPKSPQAAGATRRSCRPRPTVPQGGRREAPRPPPEPGPATATCPHISPAAPTNNGPIAGRSQQRHRRRGPGLVFRTLRTDQCGALSAAPKEQDKAPHMVEDVLKTKPGPRRTGHTTRRAA